MKAINRGRGSGHSCSCPGSVIGNLYVLTILKTSNGGNQPEAPNRHLRSDWGLWKACVYLAAIASWDIFSATPSGNGLSPVLRAVPNLSISHDETFSLGAGASFAAVCNLSA
jgi:hypothetical protein